ncbi:hypothetical protein [Tenacibaculum sp.]|uniref:hypothetical protein n=1 Tax=Tenacibaculum sp. TaxID=1906242 RepID=UPI003D1213B7
MKSTYIKITTCVTVGILTVGVLYEISDRLTHKKNSFHRYFTFHPVSPIRGIDLKYNSYYISGADSNGVYLGNITAPLRLLQLKLPEMDTTRLQLKVEQTEGLKLRKSSILTVRNPYFYITDGVTPKVLRGEIGKWYARSFMYDSAYFSNAVPIGPKSLVIRSLSSDTQEYVLGKETDSLPYVKLVPGILEKQLDGIFCTDGMLHYNAELSKLIYLYYYRNQYIVMDTTLNIVYKGKTIDTNSIAKINPTKIKSKNTKILGSPPLMVNKKSCTAGNVLLVHSNLMAKNEDPKTFGETSVIDVYNLKEGTYAFSFYIDPYKDEKLTDFYLTRNHFIAIHDHYLVLYDLNPKVFNPSLMSYDTCSLKQIQKTKRYKSGTNNIISRYDQDGYTGHL